MIDQYLPRDLVAVPSFNAKKWVEIINQAWAQLGNTSTIEAKYYYLKGISNWEYYGSYIFPIEVFKTFF